MDKVLVTGIGGNVGYGILRNIRTSYPDIFLIGTNTTRVSAGNHMCDLVFEVPFSTEKEYIPMMQQICSEHEVALIIPSTDYESYVLSLHQNVLPTVAASPAKTTKIFLDKYLTYQSLCQSGLAFAESILPSSYTNQFTQYIVKPREGRGSRNIYINPKEPSGFTDEYLIQPLLRGREITTAFYITKNNTLHGHITMERFLSGGTTIMSEVISDFDEQIEVYLQKLVSAIDIKGACNLQSIVSDGNIVPFEVNCRISGTNSIRSQFGFKDVCYTIDEYLYNNQPSNPEITKGSAIRILSDIIYPDTKLCDINDAHDKFHIYG